MPLNLTQTHSLVNSTDTRTRIRILVNCEQIHTANWTKSQRLMTWAETPLKMYTPMFVSVAKIAVPVASVVGPLPLTLPESVAQTIYMKTRVLMAGPLRLPEVKLVPCWLLDLCSGARRVSCVRLASCCCHTGMCS